MKPFIIIALCLLYCKTVSAQEYKWLSTEQVVDSTVKDKHRRVWYEWLEVRPNIYLIDTVSALNIAIKCPAAYGYIGNVGQLWKNDVIHAALINEIEKAHEECTMIPDVFSALEFQHITMDTGFLKEEFYFWKNEKKLAQEKLASKVTLFWQSIDGIPPKGTPPSQRRLDNAKYNTSELGHLLYQFGAKNFDEYKGTGLQICGPGSILKKSITPPNDITLDHSYTSIEDINIEKEPFLQNLLYIPATKNTKADIFLVFYNNKAVTQSNFSGNVYKNYVFTFIPPSKLIYSLLY